MKIWKYGLIKKDKELHLRMTNKTKKKCFYFSLALLEIFCESMMVVDFLLLLPNILLRRTFRLLPPRSVDCWPGDLLPETLLKFEPESMIPP